MATSSATTAGHRCSARAARSVVLTRLSVCRTMEIRCFASRDVTGL
jgi:hypothetical protein